MSKISIIANFYKSEKYIPRLLKSVARQKFTDWQLICVDDCSPGRDSEVITKWSKKLGIQDKVIVIRNKENLGISKAKGVGINYVRVNADPNGYTTFIDGDDYLEPDALELLFLEGQKRHVEIVLSSHYRVFKIGPFYKKVLLENCLEANEYYRAFHKEEMIDRFLNNFLGVWLFTISYWSKLYSNHLLNRLDFKFKEKDKSAYEDFFFSLAAFLQCESISFIKKPTYNWVWGGVSSSGTKDKNWHVLKMNMPILESYPMRKTLIEKYQYEKGRFFLLAEIKNTALFAWSTICKAKPNSESALRAKGEINKMLTLPAFEDLRANYTEQLARTSLQKEFLDAIVASDVDKIYDCCHRYWRQNHNILNRRYLARTILRWLQ